MGAIMVAAYSYMALVPIIQPVAIKAVTTKHERKIRMTYRGAIMDDALLDRRCLDRHLVADLAVFNFRSCRNDTIFSDRRLPFDDHTGFDQGI